LLRASLRIQIPGRIGGLKSPPYSILNREEILALPIPCGFVAPKLALNIVYVFDN
jgi:hypothetical protein